MATTATIHLRNTGNDVIVDADDLERLLALGRWYENDNGYAVIRKTIGGKKQTLRMHRVITKCPSGMVIDHLNGNKLDCRKSNLRVCTQAENARNRHSTKGYCYDKSRKAWLVRHRGKFCGRYATKAEAKEAYRLAKSGKEYQPRQRQKYMLPKHIYRQSGKWGYGITIDGVRHRKFGFATLAEAQFGLLLKLQEQRG